MNSIQNCRMTNYQNYSRNVMFMANTKPIGEAVQKATGKSGIYQAAVERLAGLQKQIEYGCSLMRLNNWFNPTNVKESDKAIYEIYKSRIEGLEKKKEEIIDEMLKQVKQDTRYKDLSDDCLKRIKEHITCGSTWDGFYFNDESINEIISSMKLK